MFDLNDEKLRQRTGTTVDGAPRQVVLQPSTEPQIATTPATTAVTAMITDNATAIMIVFDPAYTQTQ